MEILWLYPEWTESETLGLEPRYVCFNKPSKRFWCMPKFDNTVLDHIISVQSLSCVRLFATPWTADHMLTCKKVCCGLASKSWFHYREQQGLVHCKRTLWRGPAGLQGRWAGGNASWQVHLEILLFRGIAVITYFKWQCNQACWVVNSNKIWIDV